MRIVPLKDGDHLRFGAHHGPIPMSIDKWPINRKWVTGRAIIDRKPVHVHDILSAESDEFPEAGKWRCRMGHRTILSVPAAARGRKHRRDHPSPHRSASFQRQTD